jgi:hypothetical protein
MDDQIFGKNCKKKQSLDLGCIKKGSKNIIQNVAKTKESKLKTEKCCMFSLQNVETKKVNLTAGHNRFNP